MERGVVAHWRVADDAFIAHEVKRNTHITTVSAKINPEHNRESSMAIKLSVRKGVNSTCSLKLGGYKHHKM